MAFAGEGKVAFDEEQEGIREFAFIDGPRGTVQDLGGHNLVFVIEAFDARVSAGSFDVILDRRGSAGNGHVVGSPAM